MSPKLNIISDEAVYPGLYCPPCNGPVLIDSEKPSRNIPRARLRETPDHYRIDLAVPGHKREDFLLSINDHSLHICVTSSLQASDPAAFTHFPAAPAGSFVQDVKLPLDSDTDFVYAEYEAGILSVYISKATSPILTKVKNVIVY